PAELYAHACRLGVEGIVVKRAGTPYRGGRGGDWLKVKCLSRQEMVIGGYTDPSGSRSGFGALLLGVHDGAGGPLRFAGKVGTGFSQKRLDELAARMKPLERASSPFGDLARRRGLHW